MALFLCRRNPQTGLSFAKPQIIPVLVAEMEDEAGKQAVVASFRKMAAKGRAVGVGFMTEAWTVRAQLDHAAGTRKVDELIDDYNANWRGRLNEHPERVEIVMVSWQHRAGSGSGAMAEIVRGNSGKAVLQPWVDMRDQPGGGITGRFFDLLPREDS